MSRTRSSAGQPSGQVSLLLSTRSSPAAGAVESAREELHAVRGEQLAWDREEAALGLRCVAAPVLDPRLGVATAALSVSMATDGPLSPAEAAPAVRTVARALSRERPRPASG